MTKADKLLAGLAILCRFGQDPKGDGSISAEHGVVMAGGLAPTIMCTEDKMSMERWDWTWNDVTACWEFWC